jgi:hypothetical protein
VPLYVPASNTKKELAKLGKPPLDVASDYLKSLYQHALGHINNAYPKDFVDMQQKKFVLTVPAVWSDKAKDLTLKVRYVIFSRGGKTAYMSLGCEECGNLPGTIDQRAGSCCPVHTSLSERPSTRCKIFSAENWQSFDDD